MAESIRVTAVIPATPDVVFHTWLDGKRHTAFTGARATFDAVGGTFTAWGGYIQGTTFEAEPGQRIVQSWRTTEFPVEAPPSRLEVLLEAHGEGTLVTLVHTDIPDGQGLQYQNGWKKHYFDPMKRYFAKAPKPARRRKPAKAGTSRSKPAKRRRASR